MFRIQSILLALILTLLSTSICAQSFPTPSFESWDTIGGLTGNFENPTNWTTSNIYTSLISGVGVDKSLDAHSGNLSAKLVTLPLGFAGLPFASYLINGAALVDSFGSGEPDLITGGTPIQSSPARVTGWYKFDATQAFDSGTVIIYLKKWNTTKQDRDTVGIGRIGLPPVNNYTFFQVPIDLKMPGTNPDSIVAAFFSSVLPINKGNGSLWIDDVAFDTLVNRDPIWMDQVKFQVSVQDQKLQFTWELPGFVQNPKVKLHDLTGKHLNTFLLSNSSGTAGFSITALPSGIYLISLENEAGMLSIKKIFVR